MAKSKKDKSEKKKDLLQPAPPEAAPAIKRARRAKSIDELIYDVADFFKVFGDSTRLRLLHLLLREELCVGEIAQRLSMTQSAVSHQLRVLRQSDLVKYRKEGKTVIYSLDDDHVKSVLESGIEHIAHKKSYEL